MEVDYEYYIQTKIISNIQPPPTWMTRNIWDKRQEVNQFIVG